MWKSCDCEYTATQKETAKKQFVVGRMQYNCNVIINGIINPNLSDSIFLKPTDDLLSDSKCDALCDDCS